MCLVYRAGIIVSDFQPLIPTKIFGEALKKLPKYVKPTQEQFDAAARKAADDYIASVTALGQPAPASDSTDVEAARAKAIVDLDKTALTNCFVVWYPFFQEFGTHIITKVDFGG